MEVRVEELPGLKESKSTFHSNFKPSNQNSSLSSTPAEIETRRQLCVITYKVIHEKLLKTPEVIYFGLVDNPGCFMAALTLCVTHFLCLCVYYSAAFPWEILLPPQTRTHLGASWKRFSSS